MMDSAVMEFAKWFIGIIAVAFVTTMVVFLFQLNQVNNFQQEVNYQIERHGGLTESALVELNDVAKSNYGGCIVESYEDGAPCFFANDQDDPEMKSSGFFVQEIERGNNGETTFIVRDDDDQAAYGTAIEYGMTRQIGSIAGESFLKPAIIGESASRVRGAN